MPHSDALWKEKLKFEGAPSVQILNKFIFRSQFCIIEVSSSSDFTLNFYKGGKIVDKGVSKFSKKSEIFKNFENFDFFDVWAKFQRKIIKQALIKKKLVTRRAG